MSFINRIITDAKTYYHGSSNVIDNKDEVIIKEYPVGSSSYSSKVQGLGRFYTVSEENASSYIDFRNTDKGRVYKAIIDCNKPLKFKSIVDMLNKIQQWAEKNGFKENKALEINKAFVNNLKNQGYDCIIFNEGPSYKPLSRKLAAEVIIPLDTSVIQHVDEREYGTRNAGPLTNWKEE